MIQSEIEPWLALCAACHETSKIGEKKIKEFNALKWRKRFSRVLNQHKHTHAHVPPTTDKIIHD